MIDASVVRASLNGADRTGLLTVRQWWAIQPERSSTVQFATLGAAGQAGTCAATFQPTYQ